MNHEMDHTSTMMISHAAIVIGYFFIAIQFILKLRKLKGNGKASRALTMLVFVFVLCGITRIFLDLGIGNIGAEFMHIVLAVATWAYVLTNQPDAVVAGLDREVVELSEKEKELSEKVKEE